MDETSTRTIGDRVRIARRFRGMSQKALADLSGLSQSFISSIESGTRHLERRGDIIAIAGALRVSVTDITGQPFVQVDPKHGAAFAAVPDVRRALMMTSLDYSDRDATRPLPQLAADVLETTRLRVEERAWEDLGRRLPDLLLDAHAAALGTEDHASAWETLVLALTNTAVWLKDLGYVDLAWIAADRARLAAAERDDPLWMAYGQWMVSNILHAQGSSAAASRVASRAAEDAPRERSEGLQVYGMLRLMSALTTTASGGDPTAAVADAADAAGHTGEGDAFRLMFGPTNVRLWELAIALEAGEPDRVVDLGQGVEPGAIRLTERRAAYHKDMGLGLARIRLDAQAVRELQHAEALDPTRMRNHPIVREAVAGMLSRARREAGGRELRGMAQRMGVAR